MTPSTLCINKFLLTLNSLICHFVKTINIPPFNNNKVKHLFDVLVDQKVKGGECFMGKSLLVSVTDINERILKREMNLVRTYCRGDTSIFYCCLW